MSSYEGMDYANNRRAKAMELAMGWLHGDPSSDIHRVFDAAKILDEWIASGTVPERPEGVLTPIRGHRMVDIVDTLPPG